MRVMILAEVCIETAADARAAVSGGADRLELCRDLSCGGLTPSLDSVREVVAATTRPVVAMLRCRPGDFHYSESELAGMEKDVLPLLDAGASGIVFGAVDATGMLDAAAVRRIRAAMDAWTGDETQRTLVFHRAFDAVPDPVEALETLITSGVDRVLTSGHPDGVDAGLERLRELVATAMGRIEILPGGGVTAKNLQDVVAAAGGHGIHFSARAGALRTDAAAVREFTVEARALVSAPLEDRIKKEPEDLAYLQILAGLHILLGTMACVHVIVDIAAGRTPWNFGVLLVLTGVGLLRLSEFARIATLVVLWPLACVLLVGTALYELDLYVPQVIAGLGLQEQEIVVRYVSLATFAIASVSHWLLNSHEVLAIIDRRRARRES